MNKEKQPISPENSSPTKLEKRFQKLLNQTKEQWRDLNGWKVLAGAGIASGLIGLGFTLWWLRGKMKEKNVQGKIDEIAKEMLSDSQHFTQTLDEQSVLVVGPEVARQLEEMKAGEKILKLLRRGCGLLGLPPGEDTMEGHIISASTAAAAAGEQKD